MARKKEEIAKINVVTSKSTSKLKRNASLSHNKKEPAKTQKSQKKVYFGYTSRLLFNVLFFALFLFVCLIFASKTIEREKNTPINYSDVDNTSYKVYLKENEFYDKEYLEMNSAYVANLIDRINIDFNYLFNIEQLTNMTFDYKIIANLVIENNNGTNYVDKEYIIKDSSKKELNNGGAMLIQEEVNIDYQYYNNLANKFHNDTGVDTNSYLNVYLQVDKKTEPGLKYSINETNRLSVKIPLSERAIEINIADNDQTIGKQVTPKGDIVFNVEFLILEICFFIIACIFLTSSIHYISLMVRIKTPYDKYVKKLLKNYDRLIVETNTMINMDDCKIIEVKSFTELLDVRDNLKLPILYLNIVKHEKGIFYIKNNLDIYQLVVKNIDIINKKI